MKISARLDVTGFGEVQFYNILEKNHHFGSLDLIKRLFGINLNKRELARLGSIPDRFGIEIIV